MTLEKIYRLDQNFPAGIVSPTAPRERGGEAPLVCSKGVFILFVCLSIF